MKGVFKEVIVILLLCLAIILLLGVVLYEFVPMNKVVPQEVKYSATEETKQALEEKKAADSESVILTYEVSATDLSNYKKANDYVAGRKDPFARLPEELKDQENAGSTGTSTGSTSSGSSSSNGTSAGSSQGTNNNNQSTENSTNFYPEKGTK